MKKIAFVVTLVTLYALFFQVVIFTNAGEGLILILFTLSPFLVVFMAYMILKYGKPSGHTFDERFYDDWGN